MVASSKHLTLNNQIPAQVQEFFRYYKINIISKDITAYLLTLWKLCKNFNRKCSDYNELDWKLDLHSYETIKSHHEVVYLVLKEHN